MSNNDPMPAIKDILGMPRHDEWNGNGWKNGLPADETDYTKLHRDGASRGDFVRANYYATLLLLEEQRALVEQTRLATLARIAMWNDKALRSGKVRRPDGSEPDMEAEQARVDAMVREVQEGVVKQ